MNTILRTRIPLALCCALLLFAVSFPAGAAPDIPEQASQAAPRPLTPDAAFALVAGAAEKGNLQAMLELGNFYEQGIGVTRNFIKAREWYEKAADNGLAEGLYNVGVCWEIGMGTTGDMGKAVGYFRKAADKGLGQAMYKLAGLYLSGKGVEQSGAKALELLNKAVRSGHAVAANDLGVIYLQGLAGLKPDGNKAMSAFVEAAAMGSLDGMVNLGIMSRDGLGTAQDKAKGYKWFFSAWEAGVRRPDIETALNDLKSSLTDTQAADMEAQARKWLEEARQKAQGQSNRPAGREE